jgi:hypothetical protein
MRKAVALAQDRGLSVILTLHDAIYVECDSDVYTVTSAVNTLADCMSFAFRFYFLNSSMEYFANCRMEGLAFSPDFNDKDIIETSIGKIKLKSKYLDEISRVDYEKYRRYF